jgi:integrase/recombinase XerD
MRWNLRLAAANRSIWKASDLQRQLAERGLVISAGKMSALWSGQPIGRASPMTVVIRGKGSKIRYVPVMDPTAQLVAGYLDHRDRHPGVAADADPLFTGPNHSRLTRSGVAKLLARHVRAVRVRDPGWAPGLPVTPHTLRRTRAMHLVQAGVNLFYIRDLLGHADVSTTEIYARADAETKRKAIENAYEPLTPDALPDWTLDSSLIGWLDSLGR